ncbi:MAG: DUF2634 domain-containing protein [Ruminococcaceae bacterium]|nr:DUF2634 domain-containing protein [Oscillospiraceae bacterium]
MIFPDWGTVSQETAGSALPLFIEWAVDRDTGAFALRNGAFYTVSGIDAVKIWVWRTLHPESRRFCCTAWSADYGNELEHLLGGVTDQGILESRLKQYIRDALLVLPYITAVDTFSFSRAGSLVEASFTVHTVYDEYIQKLEVPIG